MDDSLQIIIYIAFLAIYFLSRFLKSNKNQAPRRPPRGQMEESSGETETPEPPMTFEDILRELTQPKERPMTRRKPEPVKPQKKEYEFKSDYPDDDEIQEVFEASHRQAKDVKTLNEMVDLGEGSIKFKEYEVTKQENTLAIDVKQMLRDPMDARKAIILKEILDRKF